MNWVATYEMYILDGLYDWINERPNFRDLHRQFRSARERTQQQALIRQMERHIHDQAYFLFLYTPLELYAVNTEVNLIPHPSGLLRLNRSSVTDQHWSVRQEKVGVNK